MLMKEVKVKKRNKKKFENHDDAFQQTNVSSATSANYIIEIGLIYLQMAKITYCIED